jgi:hypothetical protein
MPISNGLRNRIRKAIVEMGNLVAVTARRKAASQNVPGVPDAIRVNPPKPLGTHGSSITIEVVPEKMKNKSGRNIAGAEWAYEEGSGLYGPKGKKYKIEPKEATVLAFPGKRSFLLERSGQSLLPIGAEGTMFFEHVEHPGVGARPFFSTALSEKEKELLEIAAKHIDDDTIFAVIAEAWDD